MQIYIPLCFYFIDVEPITLNDGTEIYIPLCFYFINLEIENGIYK